MWRLVSLRRPLQGCVGRLSVEVRCPMVRRAAGSAALVLAGEAIPLHPEAALFEAMIEGWRRQHSARRLSPSITRARERTVRRFG